MSTHRNLNLTVSKASPRLYGPAPRSSYPPLTLKDLRNECQCRGILYTGEKNEVMRRLVNHDMMQSRAYSIGMKKLGLEGRKSRPVRVEHIRQTPSRCFNTSRELKSVNDSSTIDFAYLPKLFDGSLDPPSRAIQIPILPDVESSQAQKTLVRNPEVEAVAGVDMLQDSGKAPVMKATILTVEETLADGGAHVDLDLKGHASAMSEVVDNHAVEMGIDNLTELTETVGKAARKIVEPQEESVLRQVWNGFLDDVLGPKKKK